MRRNWKKLICLWIALLFLGFVVVSYHRQRKFEGRVEESIFKLEETVKENSVILERDWEALDKDDPEELSGFFDEKALSLYYIYFLDYNKYLHSEKEFFSGTFRTHARESALLEMQSRILGAYLTINEKWACGADTTGITGHAGEYCRILLKYYQGENYDVSWDDFVTSDQYEAFLSELFFSVETIGEQPLDESYQNIVDHAEKTASRNIYSRALSESYIFLAETAYDNYKVRKIQKDFAGAIMDAEIVYILSDTLYELDEVSAIPEIPSIALDSEFFYMHDIISDTLVVFILSTLIVVVIYFVWMKKSTRQIPKDIAAIDRTGRGKKEG